MTESAQLQKDTDIFCDRFDDEAFDFKHFDPDEVSSFDENPENVDQEKLDLTETIEKDADHLTSTFSQNARYYGFGPPNYYNFNGSNPRFYQPHGYPPNTNVGYNQFPSSSWNPTSNASDLCNGYPTSNSPYSYGHQQFINSPGGNDQSNGNIMPHNISSYTANLLNNNLADFKDMSKNNKCGENHIKKPLNAFMLYMKAIRSEVVRQVQHKDSTTINQMIGKMWQALPKHEQAYYFDLAQQERERHKLLYPEYNPREIYSNLHKKKKRKRDKNAMGKKCRARFGLSQQDKWCKHCKRKKKCLRNYVEEDNDEKVALGGAIVEFNKTNDEDVYEFRL